MSAETSEMLSQSAQLLAARESELADMNALRLDIWQRRYWWRCIDVPATRDIPGWPTRREQAAPPLTAGDHSVTQIKRRKS